MSPDSLNLDAASEMLNDFFQSLNFEFPWERFVTLPRHPAYRYQYQGGRAKISGNPRYYQCTLPLNDQSASGFEPAAGELTCFFSNYELHPLHDSDWEKLLPLFATAFESPPPLLQLTREQRLSAAKALLERTRHGGDGPVVRNACFTLCDRQTGELYGAILITLIPDGDVQDFNCHNWSKVAPNNAIEDRWGQPHLTWIFVDPHHQRRNLGKVLLREATSRLRRLGYSQLVSTFLLGDHASTLWHWKMGFQLASHPGSPRKISGD